MNDDTAAAQEAARERAAALAGVWSAARLAVPADRWDSLDFRRQRLRQNAELLETLDLSGQPATLDFATTWE